MTEHHLRIRPARWGPDLLALSHIERGVRAMYSDFGVFPPPGSDSPPAGPGFFDEGTMLWVATSPDDVPVGFIFAFALDDCTYVAQLSVHPDSQRRGVGTALLDTVGGWAAQEGLRALTLVTYTDVPWNYPWYRRIGFTDIPEGELGDEHRRFLADTHAFASGWRRSVMQRPVRQPA